MFFKINNTVGGVKLKAHSVQPNNVLRNFISNFVLFFKMLLLFPVKSKIKRKKITSQPEGCLLGATKTTLYGSQG
jgi:hypothetical protein